MRVRNAAGGSICLQRANLGGAEIAPKLMVAGGAFVDIAKIQRFIVLAPTNSETTNPQDQNLIRVLLEVPTKVTTSGQNGDGGPGQVIDISDGQGVAFLDEPDTGGPGQVIDISDGDGSTSGQTLTYHNRTGRDMVFKIVDVPGSDELFLAGEPRSAYVTEVEIRQEADGQFALYVYKDLRKCRDSDADAPRANDSTPELLPGRDQPSAAPGARSPRAPALNDDRDREPLRGDRGNQQPAVMRHIAYADKNILPDGKLLGDVLDEITKNLEPSDASPSSLSTASTALSRHITDLECQLKITRHARLLFRDFYANRPLKESLYAAEPIRRLTLLQHSLERQHQQLTKRLRSAGSSKKQEPIVLQDPRTEMLDFHLKIHDIFTSVRDRHVSYSPSELLDPTSDRGGGWSAFLGFQVEAYYDPAQDETLRRKYLVTHVVERLKRSPFRQQSNGVVFEPGVEVLTWNGMPISRAVELNAARQAGSNSAARHAHGLSLLTLRPLEASLPPDEEHVVVAYRHANDPSGPIGTILFDWQLIRIDPHLGGRNLISNQPVDELLNGFDYEGEAARLTRGEFFAFRPDALTQAASDKQPPRKEDPRGREKKSCQLRNYMRGWKLEPEPDGKHFGYIRLYTFSHSGVSEEDFVNEFRMLIEKMPTDGLIIDVRDNPGGKIRTGERLLQFLTPQKIEPARFEFLATSPVLELVCRHPMWSQWKESILEAQVTGATHSRGFPITRDLDREAAARAADQQTDFRRYPAICNRIGQRYHGPIVLITSALCYSTTDIFAAGFQDHGIGRILGVDGTTGAGGANVIAHHELVTLAKQLRELEQDPNSAAQDIPSSGGLDELLGKDLPPGISMRVAIRRSLRVGERSGMVLEDLGVKADQQHHLTRADLLCHNVDLITTAKSMLEDMPSYKLEVEVVAQWVDKGVEKVRLLVTVANASRVDLYHNNKPSESVNKPQLQLLEKTKTISWEIDDWVVDLQGTIRLEAFAHKDIAGTHGKDVLVATRCEDLRKLAGSPLTEPGTTVSIGERA